MTKVPLKYIGGHQPQGIVEVDVKKVDALLKTGSYLRIDEQVYNKEEVKEKKKKSSEKLEKESKEVI